MIQPRGCTIIGTILGIVLPVAFLPAASTIRHPGKIPLPGITPHQGIATIQEPALLRRGGLERIAIELHAHPKVIHQLAAIVLEEEICRLDMHVQGEIYDLEQAICRLIVGKALGLADHNSMVVNRAGTQCPAGNRAGFLA